jgi:hypothetical protein
MNKFTAKQKEIVARKLGYDGPMQGFDDYIKSSPALEMKYATIGDKFATRMAKGGMVRKYAAGGVVTKISDAEIKSFYDQNKNNPELLKSTAAQYGVSQEDINRAIGVASQ